MTSVAKIRPGEEAGLRSAMKTSVTKTGRGLVWRIVLPLLLGAATTFARSEELPLDSGKSSVSFVGEAFMHNFRGEAKDISGHASLEPTAVPPIQKATLRFKTAALTTFHPERDQKMRAWLQVTAQPDATFRLESVRLVAGDYQQASAANPARFRVTGAFTLHGVTKSIAGNANGWRDSNRLFVTGDATIDTTIFGLPQVREMFMTVGKDVKVTYRFAFVLPREPGKAANSPP
jgi:polyisoprenoid-binding protein YceI